MSARRRPVSRSFLFPSRSIAMTHFLLRLYDWLHVRPLLRWGLMCCALLALLLGVGQAHFKEDIGDFLPDASRYGDETAVYAQANAGNRIAVVFSGAPADSLVAAVDAFTARLAQADTGHLAAHVTGSVDLARMERTTAAAYAHVPAFLLPADVRRMERAVRAPDAVEQGMERLYTALLMPTGDLAEQTFARDPLQLFAPVGAALQQGGDGQRFSLYDDHIFTPDGRHALVLVESAAGRSETGRNARLVALIDATAAAVEAQAQGASPAKAPHDGGMQLKVQQIGAPTIAVTNARQIKTDSLWAIGLAVVLIVAFLAVVLPNVRNICLVLLTVGLGWLLGLAVLSTVRTSVSVIVLGISSVAVGIAINYPLHFVAHLRHAGDVRRNLRELASPLLIGNVTTVGAFAALVPLHASALRDLGLFAAALLVGTLAVVLVLLPHWVKVPAPRAVEAQRAEAPMAPRRRTARHWALWTGVGVALTLVLGYFSLDTAFDADLRRLNYMRPEQRELLAEMVKLRGGSNETEPVYVTATGRTLDEALRRSEALGRDIEPLRRRGTVKTEVSADRFLPSAEEQVRRERAWQVFAQRNASRLTTELAHEAERRGVRPATFADFFATVRRARTPEARAEVERFGRAQCEALIVEREGRCLVTRVLTVPHKQADSVAQRLNARAERAGTGFAFTVRTMNESGVRGLSVDFNLIGWVCGAIVFGFLWLSFGRLELALLAFLPMACSWVWILGTMHLLDLRFNLVNVILATFIFGQGDDYSIFVTEGLLYEYTYRRPMLASYRRGIVISAVIMFVGMGTLLIARHPALRSLGEITVLGMGCVVLAAALLPPWVFGRMVREDSGRWAMPVTLGGLWRNGLAALCETTLGLVLSVYGWWCLVVLRATPKRRARFRMAVHRAARWAVCRRCGVEVALPDVAGEHREGGELLVVPVHTCSDALLLAATSSRCVQVGGTGSWLRGLRRKWLYKAGLLVDSRAETRHEAIRVAAAEGRCPVVWLDEGDDTWQRALRTAADFGLSYRVWRSAGTERVWPTGMAWAERGRVVVGLSERLRPTNAEDRVTAVRVQLQELRGAVARTEALTTAAAETPADFAPAVEAAYRYKGIATERSVARTLRAVVSGRDEAWNTLWREGQRAEQVEVHSPGWGAEALLLALLRPTVRVRCVVKNDDVADVVRGLRLLPENLEVVVETART